MNRQGAIWLVVALVTISSLGILGTTLNSTIHTDPADVYDSGIDWLPSETVTYDHVPLDRGDLAEVREEVEAARSTEPTGEQTDTDSSDRQQESTGSAHDQEANGGNTENTSHEEDDPPWWDLLIDRLLGWLYFLFIAIVGVGAVYALNRFRDMVHIEPAADDGSNVTVQTVGIDAHAETIVDEAWIAMAHHIPIHDISTKTTQDCAQIAIAHGLDPDLVSALTAAFERSRYGNEPLTDADERTATRMVSLLENGDGQ